MLLGFVTSIAIGMMLTFSAGLLAQKLYAHESAPFRLCALICIGLGALTGIFHLFIWLGAFRLIPALVSLVLLVGIAYIINPRPKEARVILAGSLRWVWKSARVIWKNPQRWIALALCLFAVFTFSRILVLPPLGWDSMTYHAPKAAFWVQNGGPDQLPSPGGWGQYYRWLPGGAEALMAWSMLPFRSDLVAGVMDFLAWIGIGLAMIVLSRLMGARTAYGWAAAAYSLFLPAVWLSIGSGYVEPLLNLFFLLGTVFGLHFMKRRHPASVAMSMMAFGLAAGIKASLAIVPAVAGLIFLGVIVIDGKNRRRNLSMLAVGTLLSGLAITPWLAWNYAHTGYLFGPLPARINGFTLGQASPTLQWYESRPSIQGAGLAGELKALRFMFRSPFSAGPHLGWTSILCVLAGTCGWFRNFRKNKLSMILIAVLICSVLIFFYSPSFRVIRLLWAPVVSRFLLPAVLLFLTLSVGGLKKSRAADLWAWLLLASACVYVLVHAGYGWAPFERRILPFLGLLIFGLGILTWVIWRRKHGLVFKTTALASLSFLMIFGLEAMRTGVRYRAVGQSSFIHGFPRYWAKAAESADDPDKPRRIALTSGPHQNADNWFLYFFLGRKFQNRLCYIPITHSGEIIDFNPGRRLDSMADRLSWLERLEEAEIFAVMSFFPRSVELGWMENDALNFRRLEGDGKTWGFYEFTNHNE